MVYDEWFVRTLNFKIQFKSKIQDNVGVLVPRERRSHFNNNNNNNNNNDLFQTQSVHIQKKGKQNWCQKEYTSADIIRKQIKYIG